MTAGERRRWIVLEALARRAGMSTRTFHRRGVEQLATTPATLRVEHARDLLVTSDLPSQALAGMCGSSSTARLHRAFVRELGVGPRVYRLLHRN